MRTLFALFLVAHGLIHASYLIPIPADAKGWPFTLGRSWLLTGLDAAALRPIGLAMAVVAAVAFSAAGLGLLGVPFLEGAWQALAVVGAVASLLLLAVFWNSMLVLGIVISAAVIYAVFWAHWPTAVFGT